MKIASITRLLVNMAPTLPTLENKRRRTMTDVIVRRLVATSHLIGGSF
jgi:hypothetical protein